MAPGLTCHRLIGWRLPEVLSEELLDASTGTGHCDGTRTPTPSLSPHTQGQQGDPEVLGPRGLVRASRRTAEIRSAGLTGADSGLGGGWDIFWTSAGLWAGTDAAEG